MSTSSYNDRSSIIKINNDEEDNVIHKLNSRTPSKKEELSVLDKLVKTKVISSQNIKKLTEKFQTSKLHSIKSESTSRIIPKNRKSDDLLKIENEHLINKDLIPSPILESDRSAELVETSPNKRISSNLNTLNNSQISPQKMNIADQSSGKIKPLGNSQSNIIKNIPSKKIDDDSLKNTINLNKSNANNSSLNDTDMKRQRVEMMNQKNSKDTFNQMNLFLKGMAENILNFEDSNENKTINQGNQTKRGGHSDINHSKIIDEDDKESFTNKSKSLTSSVSNKKSNRSSNDGDEPGIKLNINASVNLMTNLKGEKGNAEIFWTREEIQDFQSKIKLAGAKIREKQKLDFDILYSHVYKKEKDQVLRILKNDDFRDFYKLELKKPILLELIFFNNMPDVVVEMTEFDSNIFSFNNGFIFQYIERIIKKQEYLASEIDIQEMFANFINFELYNKDHSWLLLWFYSHFSYYTEAAKILRENKRIEEDELREALDTSDFERLIDDFADNKQICIKAIQKCLEFGLENLAIAMIFHFKCADNKDLIKTATDNCKLRYLQIIWEKYNDLENKLGILDGDENKDGEDSDRNNANEVKKRITSQSSIEMSNSDRKSKISKKSEIDVSVISDTIKKDKDQYSNNTQKQSIYFSHKLGKASGSSREAKSINNKTIIRMDVSSKGHAVTGEAPFTLSELIEELNNSDKKAQVLEIITSWKYIERDKDLLETLFSRENFEEIAYLIWKKKVSKWKISEDHFELVIKANQLELIPFFLTLPDCRVILKSKDIHKMIVDQYCKYGNKLYYAAVMLSYVDVVNWSGSLTKELCRMIFILMKNKDIMNCHSPIITCILLCEFMKKISEASVENSSRCNKVIESLTSFINSIHEANPNEVYIKFLMQQKDIKGRNSFEIASENNFFNVLESPELGTIVKKMWNGKLSAYPFTNASSINKFIYHTTVNESIWNSFENTNKGKYFTYHMNVWFDSCSHRFFPETITSIILILVYNLYIFYLVDTRSLMKPITEYNSTITLLFYGYLFIVLSLNLSNLNYMNYSYKSGKQITINFQVAFELLLLLLSLSLFLDPANVLGYKAPSDTELFVESDIPTLIRITVLAFCDLIVWMKITVIMLTWRDIGPLIHMIYLMMKIMIIYIFTLGLYLACFAGIFTIIFYKHSSQFDTFINSVTTLFSGFINNFDCFDFNSNYQIYGGVALMFYVTLSGMLIINLLIAFLSNFYRGISRVVDSTHRAVLIKYYKKYKWNPLFGWMIYLVPPFNIINYIVLAVTYFIKNEKKLKRINTFMCKFYHLVFIMPLLLLSFIFYSLFISIVAYLKGIITTMSFTQNNNYNAFSAIFKTFIWSLFGFPFLILIIFQDCYYICKTCFDTYPSKISEINRIKKFITEEDVVTFLKFIHTRSKTESNDLHTIFIDYLAYESFILTEKNTKLKERSNYLTKLQTANSINSSRKNKGTERSKNAQVLINKGKKDEEGGMINSFTKKNLIIIEILENFLIDDSSDNHVVDIEKLRMLLPKTTKIDNDYLKRLVFTDISSLNKAINKLKTKKNVFLQNALLRKIVASAIRVDCEMDEKDIQNQENLKKNVESEKFTKKDSLKKFLEGKKIDDVAEYEFYSEMYSITSRIKDDIEDIIKSKIAINTKEELDNN